MRNLAIMGPYNQLVNLANKLGGLSHIDRDVDGTPYLLIYPSGSMALNTTDLSKAELKAHFISYSDTWNLIPLRAAQEAAKLR